MRYTETDIKAELLENWKQLEDSTYPEDLLTEWADSAVPVYTRDIIEDWTEMPSEYDDTWQEHTEATNSMGIADLMRIDLYAYYLDTYTRIYREIAHDMEQMGNCDTCNALYDLSSRDGRCGDCGECAEHCQHETE